MALQLPPIIGANQFQRPDLGQTIASFFNQRRETQEAEKIAQAQQAIQNTRDLAGQFQAILDTDDFDLRRRGLSRLGQELINSGDEKGFEFVKQALAIENNDELRLFLTRQVTKGIAVTDQLGKFLNPDPVKKTTLQKNLIAAGFTPGTPEFETKLEELISRPIGTTVNVGTQGFKIPAGFMLNPDDPTGQSVVPIQGGPAGKLSGEGAKLEEISRGGLAAVAELEAMIASGNITQETLGAAIAPGIFNFFKSANVQEFETLSDDLADMIGRLRSGGAINTDEEAKFVRLLPVFGDKDSVIDNKLRRLKAKFINISSKVSLAPIKGADKLTPEEQAELDRLEAKFGNP